MKTKHASIIVPLALICLSASGVATDIISRLGLTHSNAQNYLLANITGSFSAEFDIKDLTLFYPRVNTLPGIITGDKAGAAKELCQYLKDYVNSEEFLIDYQAKRANAKPTYEPERIDPASLENMRTVIRDLEDQLAELRKSPSENAQAIAVYEPMLEGQKATLAEFDDLTPNKTKWEKNYPSDPAVLVRRRLQEYLDLVTTVDFNAKLTAPDNYKIQKFVNPSYESKPSHWKACFRAGKEVNDAVTLFVKDWMKGEIISGSKTKAPKDLAAVASASVNQGSSASSNNSSANGTNSQQDQAATSETSEETQESPKERTGLMGKLKKAKALLKD